MDSFVCPNSRGRLATATFSCNHAVKLLVRHSTDRPKGYGMEDRRKSHRESVCQVGYVSHMGFSTRCTIVNISSEGATIEVADPTCIPKTFKLMTATDRVVRNCRTVWIKRNLLGIQFENANVERSTSSFRSIPEADASSSTILGIFTIGQIGDRRSATRPPEGYCEAYQKRLDRM